MASGLIERVDGWAGQGIEAAIGAHHRRRLQRVGRIDQLNPPPGPSLWAAGDPPPRAGGALDVLVDGGEALPRIAEALAGARLHVHIAGWHVTPDFGLTRDSQASRLRDLLGDLAERVEVRVLLWAGAPAPVFTPARAAVRRVREELIRGTRVQCALDFHERPMHCHHEKLVIVDGEVAFVGGIDLTSLGGDRFDSSDHLMRGRLGWPAEGRVVEEYGTRVNPRFGTKTFRNGIDIDAGEGANIHAVFPGHVLYTGWFRGYGNLIIVDHGSEYYTLYAHVADIKVAEGDDVKQGQVIGTVGDTGSLQGPRLYFEVRYQGKPQDPAQWLRPRG